MEEVLNLDDNSKVINAIVARAQFPRYIYKYTSINTLKLVLQSSKIKFSKPSEFNDPFDCNLTIETKCTDEEVEAYIRILNANNNLTKEQIAELRIRFANPKELYEITNKSLKTAKEHFGVSCFSKINSNLLMWAHYADHHKGACLKFDILEDTDFFITPLHIVYEKDYPKYNYITNREGIGKFLLETKSKDWEYEQEVRIMKEGSGFYKFKKDSLIEITFGVRTTNEERDRIISLKKENAFEKINFSICNQSKSKFELDINKLQ